MKFKKMENKLIKTDSYLLLIDEGAEIKEGNYDRV